MSKLDDTIAEYKKVMTEKHGMSVDDDLLHAVTKSLGPLIYSNDSARVSCSDQAELDRVKNNFLMKKLGLGDGDNLDAAMKEVCQELGTSNPNKFRAIFYYKLVKKFNKESMYM